MEESADSIETFSSDFSVNLIRGWCEDENSSVSPFNFQNSPVQFV